jgi:hypothetical protein
MQIFDQLLHNKTFLSTFLNVCQSQNGPTKSGGSKFTFNDGTNLAGLLTVELNDNLPYLYSIVKQLLTDYIALNFETTTSQVNNEENNLVEALVTNWLSIFMYDFIRDTDCGANLYKLIKSIHFNIEMAPCDQINEKAFNSMCSEYLLENDSSTLKYQVLFTNVLDSITNGNDLNPIVDQAQVKTCRLLDCDTIQQSKRKILNQCFKSSMNSNIDQYNINDIDLFVIIPLIDNNNSTLNTTSTQIIQLQDFYLDANNANTNGIDQKLLTLKDYNIQSGSIMNICYKKNQQHQQQLLLMKQQQQQQQISNDQDPNNVYMSTLSMNNVNINEYVPYSTLNSSQQQQQQKVQLAAKNHFNNNINCQMVPLLTQNVYHLSKSNVDSRQSKQTNINSKKANKNGNFINFF